MRRPGFIFAVLLGGWMSCSGQTASVHGSGLGYAGKTVYISIAWNPVITIYQFSEVAVCSEEGTFDIDIPLDSPRVVQFETGMYQAYLYMEPGYHYEVVFPEYAEKERDDRISPFYQAVVIPLPVSSRTSLATGETIPGDQEINGAIADFDSRFTGINNQVILQRRKGLSSSTDSIIQQLESEYSDQVDPFFSSYRKFRYGILKLNEGRTGLEDISLEFLGPTVMEWHPGFVELFRAMFKDFIFYYSQTDEGQGLRSLINRKQDFRKARELVLRHPAVWSDTLAELILLQEFSDLFYQGEYHKEALLIMLDSMAGDPVSEKFGTYASQLKNKLSSLMTGHNPPPLALEDLDGKLFTLEDFKGKYTYLFFGTPDHYGCMMEYPFLQSYTEKHAEYLNVVTVMASGEKSELREFMTRNGYGWKALHYQYQPGVLTDYQVRAYPTAYLIDRDGKLLLSPASLPTDGFEQQLFRIMRSRGEI
jgi:thiol-disulfide isomerase/thioredoxin